MSGYNQNYYRDPYGYGYIQRSFTYNYAGYYQLTQFEQQLAYQQSWRQVPIANTQPLRVLTTQLTQTTTQLIQTTQLTQTTNVVIPSQNITTIMTLNTTTQIQNTTTLPNIFNLTNQPIRMTTGATAGGSN